MIDPKHPPLNPMIYFELDPLDGKYYRKRDDAPTLWYEGGKLFVDDEVHENCTDEEREELEQLVWMHVGEAECISDYTDWLKLTIDVKRARSYQQ